MRHAIHLRRSLGTLVIIFGVLFIAVRPYPKLMHPGFPIGMTVCFSIIVTGPMTGGGINPARALGAVCFQPSFWDSRAGKYFYIYVLGPMLASLLGPLLAWLVYGSTKSGMQLPRMATKSA